MSPHLGLAFDCIFFLIHVNMLKRFTSVSQWKCLGRFLVTVTTRSSCGSTVYLRSFKQQVYWSLVTVDGILNRTMKLATAKMRSTSSGAYTIAHVCHIGILIPDGHEHGSKHRISANARNHHCITGSSARITMLSSPDSCTLLRIAASDKFPPTG